MRIGYQASHEQFSPDDLLRLAIMAEKAGFEFVLSSDHISPWSHVQDNSGFAWSWLGAALQATSMSYSVVTPPGYRYHPAVLAQAIATLAKMFPGRFEPCLGSGEALNEHVVGRGWPSKGIRNQVLYESAQVMRRLWRGETVSYDGAITVEGARLYTLPEKEPNIIGAALSESTAEWLGSWADGLITISGEIDKVRRRVAAFQKGGGQKKPMVIQAHVSYAETYEEALDGALKQWTPTMMPSSVVGDLAYPEQFESLAGIAKPEHVERQIKIVTKPEACLEWIQQLASAGFETVVLHNVNRRQERFIKDFGERLLPKLR